ncbi:hypothetical protein [Marinobacter subterrani]|uniref:hypothetical protein n=1 Tax=Marinobacter subterrani TaxID=1658765 RepID=UPI002357391E|nr:hypothetical protein [Marinobacter subterrani]
MTNKARQRRLMVAPLVGLAGTVISLTSSPALAFGWHQATELTEAGAETVARFDVSEGIRYQIDGLCQNDRKPVIEFEIQADSVNEEALAKYFPKRLINVGEKRIDHIPVEVTFDWSAASNPWYAHSTRQSGFHRFTLPFDKQSYYTNKVRKLLQSSTYLNLKVESSNVGGEFTISIPLINLKKHLKTATQCKESPGASIVSLNH